jgi:DNA topoisomerase VI subunit B
MKKIIIFSIFTILMIFSLQQLALAEIEGKEERKKAAEEAIKKNKREITANGEERKIEEKEIIKEKEVRKIQSKLIKLLPTENKLEEITQRVIWEYVDKQSTLDEETGIETMTALLKDISRVYDPIINKYKVSTIQIEIIKYDDKYEL